MTTYLIDTPYSAQLSPISESLFRGDFECIRNYPPALQRAIDFMCRHYTDPLSLSDVAQQAFVSSSHLSYLFRKHLELRFKSLLEELRTRKAIDLTHQNPEILITDLSLLSGFFDLSHFEKIFRRHTGMTPREYRERVKNHATVADSEMTEGAETL